MDDLTKRRLEKEGRVFTEHEGEIWFPYCFEYEALGKTYGLTLWARNVEEAKIVGNDCKKSLRLMGEVIEEIPA